MHRRHNRVPDEAPWHLSVLPRFNPIQPASPDKWKNDREDYGSRTAQLKRECKVQRASIISRRCDCLIALFYLTFISKYCLITTMLENWEFLFMYAFTFFINGVISGTIGPLIPFLAAETHRSETDYSFVFICRSGGALLGAIIYKGLQYL